MPEASFDSIRAGSTRLRPGGEERWQAWFPNCAWAAMLALLLRQVLVYGTRVPFNDDWILLSNLRPDAVFHAPWLWWVHNEHRIPLAKLVYLAAVGGTHDIRAGTFVTVALLAATAWACMRMARRLRGRAHFTDAFFPLLWMNGAQSENVLNSFQVAFSIPAAITAIGLIVVTAGDERPSGWRVAGLGLVALAMPLTGGIGLPHAVAWIAWFGIVFASARKSALARDRWAGRIALVCALSVAALTAWYFVDYRLLPGFRAPTPRLLLETALQFMTRGVGETAITFRPVAAYVFLALSGWTVWLLVRSAADSHTSWARALGIAVVIAAMWGTALSVGYGRAMDGDGAGLLERYGMVAAPVWCALFAGACLSWSRPLGRALGYVLFGIVAVSLIPNFRSGEREGTLRRDRAQAFEADFARGLSIEELAPLHWRTFYYSPEGFVSVLHDLEAARLGPFRDRTK